MEPNSQFAPRVLLAIDDLQWFDSISARALRYALRRLETERRVQQERERISREDLQALALPREVILRGKRVNLP